MSHSTLIPEEEEEREKTKKREKKGQRSVAAHESIITRTYNCSNCITRKLQFRHREQSTEETDGWATHTTNTRRHCQHLSLGEVSAGRQEGRGGGTLV